MKIIEAKDEKELEKVYEVRKKVFVTEQKVPLDIEIDAYEDKAHHFLGTEDDQAISASRLRIVEDYGKLERICVLASFRGKSLGKQMIAYLEAFLIENNIFKSKLNAQSHAIEFYEKLGYEVISDEFMDAGIPHKTMIKHLK